MGGRAGKPLRAIGLMSGTSLDGVDAAWIETDGVVVGAVGPSVTVPYSAGLRGRLRGVLDRAAGLVAGLVEGDAEILAVTRELMAVHLAAVRTLDRPADVIGLHGQTILHAPHLARTWQIGDAGWLAGETGVPVAFDFRSADVAAGGQGAPWGPVFQAAWAGGLERPLGVLNLGGVGNVTWIGADGALIACDTGPGNALLDDWAMARTGRPRDEGGALALAGCVDRGVLARLLADPYFAVPAPKSLDRLHFAWALEAIGHLSAEDGAATLVAFTAGAVAATALPGRPARLLVAGGGRHNPAVMVALAAAMPCPVAPVEAVGWDGDALEAQCFGFLAVRTLGGLPISFPGTTGVPRPLGGGRIAKPGGAG